MKETGVPGEKTPTNPNVPSYSQFSHMLRVGFEPASGERQLAVSGNVLDHTAFGVGLPCLYIDDQLITFL